MKSYGSIWLLAATHLKVTSPESEGLLYLDRDGTLIVVDKDAEAPTSAGFVVSRMATRSPEHIAARLAHVAVHGSC